MSDKLRIQFSIQEKLYKKFFKNLISFGVNNYIFIEKL